MDPIEPIETTIVNGKGVALSSRPGGLPWNVDMVILGH